MSEDFYRKAVSDAEASKNARDEAHQRQAQQARDSAARILAASKNWYDNVFLPEIQAANNAVADKHGQFEILKAQQMGSAIVCEFRFDRPNNSPQ